MTPTRSQAEPSAAPAVIEATVELLVSTRFIDLRAPVEYARGALPGAVNLPLLLDSEREQIGITYARNGPTAAIELGHRLVTGARRRARIHAWVEFAREHPRTCLYCARGGLRSQIAQQWLLETGLAVPRVHDGFKALRRLCLDVLARVASERPMVLIGGRTGSGKTELLRRAPGGLDLEHLARHRGSAFGALDAPQPSQVDFENALAVAALRHAGGSMVLEDESGHLGRLALPRSWYERMQASPILLLEAGLAARCRRIEREYVDAPLDRGTAPETLRLQLQQSLGRIRRRLGDARHAEVSRLLDRGFSHGHHRPWIERLLDWYYDPLYDRQLERRRPQVIARGDAARLSRLLQCIDDIPR